MDIHSASSAAAQIPTSGAGAAESAATVSKIAADSSQERKEVGRSDPGADAGRNVDIDA